jgi:hypothetical protein
MKRMMLGIACGLFLCVSTTQGIGLQHGVFRSQSTQGTPWQGTAVIENEQFDITVYPDYLDVNLEWTFRLGGTPPDSFKNALEIVGNLNLDAHSSVVGLITWYKGQILKGKLKSDSIARAQYEKVVDRSSTCPPPPRDPVLFEYGWGEDNYYISIFPAEFNATRKVRIRYLVPAFKIDGVNKIIYPYSFTANPVVTIQTGHGVAGYIVEATQSKKYFEKAIPIVLDDATYSFEAHSRDGRQSISYIIPLLSGAIDGSVMYCGAFSTPSFSGEMSHIAVSTAQQALAQSSAKEDYVVLWRWNHPEILTRYGRQIVEQSSLLKNFLSTLSAADKRAAMVISKEGQAPIVFHLDKQGGAEFNRMLAYLDSLAAQTVADPPMAPIKDPAVTYDTAQAIKDFNNAIQAALTCFQRDAASLKHLLILTAGPQLVRYSTSSPQTFKWDSTIDVNMLSSYLSGRVADSSVTLHLDQAYWPGANLCGFMQKYHSNLNAWATVGNGVDTACIRVLVSPSAACTYCTWEQTTDMHVYSNYPLTRQIRWTINNGASPIAAFTEFPRVIVMADSMQYSRLIGSSSYLVPLAASMPTSLASALGFVDKKYSLVALEEDALPTEIAKVYETQGVPELNSENIFAAPGEHFAPVSEWLIAHPPQSMRRILSLPTQQNPIYYLDWARGGEIDEINIAMRPDMAGNDNKARVLPAADALYSVNSQLAPDYTTAIAGKAKVPAAVFFGSKLLLVKNGRIFLNLDDLANAEGKIVSIALYTCSGKKIGVWNFTVSRNFPTSIMAKLARGAYIARISCGAVMNIQRIVVR